MTDKLMTARISLLDLSQAVIAWRDVRERIFRHEGLPPPTLWTELGHKEHALMTLARGLDEPWPELMEVPVFSPWGLSPSHPDKFNNIINFGTGFKDEGYVDPKK